MQNIFFSLHNIPFLEKPVQHGGDLAGEEADSFQHQDGSQEYVCLC